MTHLKKITLTSLFIFCVGVTTQVMAGTMVGGGSHDIKSRNTKHESEAVKHWGEMTRKAREIQDQHHLSRQPLISANPFEGQNEDH